MNESEFVEESLRLKTQLLGLKTSLDHLRKLFEFCLLQFQNKNDAEARKIFSRYWHMHNQELRVFHNLSENEIYNLVKKRSTINNAKIKLLQMGLKLTELAGKLDSWVDQGKMVYQAIRLCQSVQKESRRTAAQDVRSRIREMQQAKDEMVQVFELVKQLSVFMGVPFVSSYITMYAAIFSKLGDLCDKIAGYALKIAAETEAVLGQNGLINNMMQNKNSWWNQTREISAQSKKR